MSVSSTDETVATVEINSWGDGYIDYAVTPVGTGTCSIIATLGNLTDSFEVTVTERPTAESISFADDTPSEITTHYQGSEITVEIDVTPSDADISSLALTSSEPTMIEIMRNFETNRFTVTSIPPNAVAGTTITLTATLGELTQTHTLTMVRPQANSISLSSDTFTVAENATDTLTITTTPQNADLTSLEFTYSTDSIASVEASGTYGEYTITGLSAGETTVTATLGNITQTFTVTVTS